MKLFIPLGLTLLAFGSTVLGQSNCSNIKIISPVVSKPTEAAIASATCSTLVVKWKGRQDQTYLVSGNFTELVSDISCDNNFNCTAYIPVTPGTTVTWSVQAIGIIDERTFYSYPLRGGQDYAIPNCDVNVPPVVLSEIAKDATDAISHSNFVKVLLYPNPVMDVLSVKWNGEYKGSATLTVMDASGSTVKLINVNKQQTDYTDRIRVFSLRPGLYYVGIKVSNGSSFTTTFIKQ